MSGFTPVALGTARLLLPIALRAVAWIHPEQERQQSLSLAADKCASAAGGRDLAAAARIAARVAVRASDAIPETNPEPYQSASMVGEAAYLAARAVQCVDEQGVGGAELAGEAILAMIDAVKEAAGDEEGEFIREIAEAMALRGLATAYTDLEDMGVEL